METNRLQSTLKDLERRVEVLREQAISMQKERESLLELLQTLQDNSDLTNVKDADREDIDWQLERLVIRCLTVDVTVSTPRNDSQEDAFKKITDIIEDLKMKMKKDPYESEKQVESFLNASLPEPLSGNINQRFQDKLLGCTVDDQKGFRLKLQKMYNDLKKITEQKTNNCNAVNHDDTADNGTTNTEEDTDESHEQTEPGNGELEHKTAGPGNGESDHKNANNKVES